MWIAVGQIGEQLRPLADRVAAGSTLIVQEQAGTGTARALTIGTSGAAPLALRTNGSDRWTIDSSGHLTAADALNIIVNATTGTKIATATTQKLGFWNATPVVQQVGGVTITNNVTAGGVDNTIANYTDLTIYANDAAAIRNNL